MNTETAALPRFDHKPSPITGILFLGLLATGLLFTGYSLVSDISEVGGKVLAWFPYLLLGVALLIALGFEFVNGFHDTANAVATVIYTHSLPPTYAVMWSGFFNFLGVLVSSGTVAFGIISLLPVELILQVGSGAGFAMVFALLIAAIVWNLGTWWLGLPASSSHTLIGSIIGVGVANALMHGRDGTSGVDWGQATKIGYSLVLFPNDRIYLCRDVISGVACTCQTKGIIRGAQRQSTTPLVDSGHPYFDLYRCFICSRIKRRIRKGWG